MTTTQKEFLINLGMEIKVARIRKGMTTNSLSEACGLHRATINEIEGGRTESKILNYKRIADALGVDVKNFL